MHEGEEGRCSRLRRRKDSNLNNSNEIASDIPCDSDTSPELELTFPSCSASSDNSSVGSKEKESDCGGGFSSVITS